MINSAKAREFWVDPESIDDEVGIYDTFDKHPGQGPLQWQASLIHVIEKSAYDKAVNVLKDVEKLMSGAPSSAPMTDELILKHVRQTLKELGELTGEGV